MKRRRLIAILAAFTLLLLAMLGAGIPPLKRHIESVNCGNQMSSIGFGAYLWAGDNSNRLANDWSCLSNEICISSALLCPSDRTKTAAVSWTSFTTNNCSYEMLRPGMAANDFTNAYFRCSTHGHLGFADGTVFDGKRRRTKSFF